MSDVTAELAVRVILEDIGLKMREEENTVEAYSRSIVALESLKDLMLYFKIDIRLMASVQDIINLLNEELTKISQKRSNEP